MRETQNRSPKKDFRTNRNWMIHKVTSGKVDTATELQKDLQEGLNVKLNPKTIRRTLKRAGMKAITKKRNVYCFDDI